MIFPNIYYLTEILEIVKAILTDKLTLIEFNAVSVSAEDTSGFVLLENDLIIGNENFDTVSVLNVHCFADFLGNYDSAKFVDFSYNAG